MFAIAGQQRLFGTAKFRTAEAHHLYAIAPGDNRFLFLRRVGAEVEAKPAPLVLVENWFEELKQRLAKK